MPKKVYVGADASESRHECLADDSDEPSRGFFPFENSKEGMESLLKAADGIPDAEITVIGFEATGHYGENLKSFLERAGRPYAELNPAQAYHFVKSDKGNLTKRGGQSMCRPSFETINKKAYGDLRGINPSCR